MNYRPRLTSIRNVADRETPVPRDANGNIETDLDACRELLFAVLETAIRDFEFLSHVDAQPFLSASQKKRRTEILEDGDPNYFFRSDWFADICHFLGLNPESVRDLLKERSPTSALAHAS
jgi:hypothetical protein